MRQLANCGSDSENGEADGRELNYRVKRSSTGVEVWMSKDEKVHVTSRLLKDIILS